MTSIKTKIHSVSLVRQLLKNHEKRSCIKLDTLKSQYNSYQQYMSDLLGMARLVSSNGLHTNTNGAKKLVIVFSSNTGFSGELNTNLFKKITAKYGNSKCDVDLFCVGKKSFNYFVNKGFNIVGYQSIDDSISEGSLSSLVQFVCDSMHSGYSDIEVCFNRFVGNNRFTVSSFKFAPSSVQFIDEFAKMMDIRIDDTCMNGGSVELGLDADVLFESMLSQLVSGVFYGVLLNNKICELVSRVSLLKGSSSENEVMRGLILSFNKVRETLIAQKVLEIMSSKMTMEESCRVA